MLEETRHRRAPRSTPHPSPFPVPCSTRAGGDTFSHKGRRGSAAFVFRPIFGVGGWHTWQRQSPALASVSMPCSALTIGGAVDTRRPPSPLVGEGGPAWSPQPAGRGGRAGTDEGCWKKRGTAALHAAPLIRRLFPSLACARAGGDTFSHKGRRGLCKSASANGRRWRLAEPKKPNSPFSPCGRRWPGVAAGARRARRMRRDG